MHLAVFETFAGFVDLFDSSFTELKINNKHFHTTKLFPQEPVIDNDGSKKAEHGRWGLIGHGAYIEAIVTNEIDVQDYNGENVLITDATDEAAAGLAKWGLGYADVEIYSYEELEEALDERSDDYANFYGYSFKLITWWKSYHKVLKQVAPRFEQARNKEQLQKTILKKMPAQDAKILDDPFFTSVKVWGHPAGEKSLKEWILELAIFNPDTPYGIHIYDYHLGTDQCQNYVNAFLTLNSDAKQTALKNCRKFD